MRAVLTAVIAAIEAAAVALAGLALVAVPVLLVWWLTFSLAAEPTEVIGSIAGVWLLGHLVPLTFAVSAEAAMGFGLAPEPFLFTLSLAPLGLALLTALLAFRAGWRFAGRGGWGLAGVLGGALGFAAAAAGVSVVGASLSARPVWFVILVPALCYAIPTAAGFLVRAVLLEHDWWRTLLRAVLRRLEWIGALRAAALPARTAESLRLAAGSLAAVVGLAALGVAVAIVVGYVEIVTLSQGLQLDLLGLVVLFLLSLAMLPIAWIWAIAWFAGPGFGIGAGTSVTPFETLLGPLPALPLFGAVPHGWGWAGGLAPALIVLVGVVVGALAGARPELRRSSLTASIAIPVAAAALAGLAVAGLSALVTGGIGPGRLAETGPQPWLVGGLVALELVIGLVPGVLARRLDAVGRLREAQAGIEQRIRTAAPFDRRTDTEPAEVEPPTAGYPAAGRSAAGESPFTAETVELDPLPADPVLADPVPADPVPEPTPADAAEAETREIADENPGEDALLRAFSWENGHPAEPGSAAGDDRGSNTGSDTGSGTGDRPGWRRPWRKR